MTSVTIEEIETDLFRIEIPLPLPALKSVNCYALKNRQRNLVVDTGMDTNGCMNALMEGLEKVGVDIETADLYVTHGHGDHMGLAGLFLKAGNRVFLNEIDLESLRQFENFDVIIAHYVRHGYPEKLVQAALDRFPTDRHRLMKRIDMKHTNVSDGDSISVGEHSLVCVHTPGHSPGHTCLYDPQRKILFSGDHILGDISPGIQCADDRLNPIESYMKSLARIDSLEVETILPGHRGIIRHPKQRIAELLAHHRIRCDEVIRLVAKKPGTAYDLAAKMTWDMHFSHWEDVPPEQRWFATGEAISHLRYLEEKGKVVRSGEGSEKVVFHNAS